ncbi:leucine--tRNA ligase [Hyalangium rubrum]|uniref:Leucine--tRNA ligase n=1 Tax=Hyalangium rubrum TaxID=3103134 RepID=A0ABU5HDZ2_9BACT|nr:leucine--tRNA ligase [Hyalangium sp. s54d21]MDY7231677.1 leucine--tRNA ligase [Hyalangium sp. s54d21]
MSSFDSRTNDRKWQERWEQAGVFRATLHPNRPKAYILDMFPYPSGAGLHVGHPEGYTATDIIARWRRMQGWDVLHPMGWDAFGLPAENYAISTGVHPAKTTAAAIRTFKQQIQALGLSYDWERELSTTSPEYFRWTQWIFLKLHERGLAYQAMVPINWCPKDLTGLANEEVHNGKCERCGTPVERRDMRQWMLKITAYGDRLVDDLEGLDWPESTLAMQRNWIGRSVGAEIEFPTPAGPVRVFTTRPDTLFGATYLVLSPEHPLVPALTTPEQRASVEAYRQASRAKSDMERTDQTRVKTGVATGAMATHPATGQGIPIWIADYVLAGYGTGAIMAVPAHDERDHAFARTFGLPIVEVVRGGQDVQTEPFTGEGVAVNSPAVEGLPTHEAKEKMIAWIQERGVGKATTTYRLRDWVFSRQRYWGEPIPIIHCQRGCGAVPVPEDQLPVTLPDVERYEPSGTGESPLAAMRHWVETTCPQCGGPAERETNTMPNWAGSCWYYLRFTDPRNAQAPFNRKAADAWLPVDLYVGGTEHAVLHLLYARFWHKFLFDLGLLSTREPFQKLRHQGMVLAYSYQDSQGRYRGYDEIDLSTEPPTLKEDGSSLASRIEKMSKSKKNVINPDEVVERYGADGLRLYEMFMGDFELSKPWDVRGIEGVSRFLGRVWRLVDEWAAAKAPSDDPHLRLRHATIQAVGERIELFKFNTAISSLMEYVGELVHGATRADLETLTLLLSPFAPHTAEAMWERLGHAPFACTQPWPTFDPALTVKESVTVAVQVNGKLRATFDVPRGTPDEALKARALELVPVQRHLEGKVPKRIIVVRGTLVNVVV